MLTGYERYQLEWMIAHGHSLGELVDELTFLQNDLESNPDVNLSVRDVFDAWLGDRGFGSEIFACEEEWRDVEGKLSGPDQGDTSSLSLPENRSACLRESRNPHPGADARSGYSLGAEQRDASAAKEALGGQEPPRHSDPSR